MFFSTESREKSEWRDTVPIDHQITILGEGVLRDPSEQVTRVRRRDAPVSGHRWPATLDKTSVDRRRGSTPKESRSRRPDL